MSAEQTQEVAVRFQDVSPEYAEIMALGKVLQASGYFKDVRDQAQAVTKILFGRELGFSPIVSMSGIHIIEGKPALSSNLMATLIKRSGKYDYRVKHRFAHLPTEPCPPDCLMWTNTECILLFREKNGAGWETVGESSFTMDDAKAAKVLRDGGSWSKYPKAMLFARALSQGLRTYCPDVSAAPIYNPEEMGAEVNEEGDLMTLPKRVVEVTEKDIPIAKPKSARPAEGGTRDTGPVEPAAAETDDPNYAKAVEKHGQAVVDMVHATTRHNMGIAPLPPVDELAAQAKASMEPKEGTVPEGCIEIGQQINFGKMFKDALPKKLQKEADAIRHEWLKREGIVDSFGNGTSRAIQKDSFYEVREKAVDYAATYSI